jgi:hypothetical protein
VTATETAALQLHEPYNDIRTQMAELAVRNENAVFDYADPKGAAMAKSHIGSLRSINGAIDRKTKELKAEALEYNRRVEATRKELKAEVAKMIAVHEEPLLRIAQEEADRKAAIQQAIDAITEPALGDPPANAAELAENIKRVEAVEIDADTYQERMAEATKLKDDTLATMRETHAALVKAEAEQAELERLRAEQEARERKEREERIAAEAAEKAKREAEERAERERVEAERKAQAERDAAAQREREAQERAERAEREAKEAEAKAKADADRRVREAEEARERKAQAERDAQAKREANAKHVAKIKREASEAIYAAIDKTTDASIPAAIVDAIAAGDIPHVSITF